MIGDGNLRTLVDDLTELLDSNDMYVTDGTLNKDLVVRAALSLDEGLLELLIGHDRLKKEFFSEAGKVLAFDKVKFQKFVLNKGFLPDSYTQFRVNIGLAVHDRYLNDTNDVFLNWPYKDCVLEGGQDTEDASRDEKFWNKSIAPDEISNLLKPKALGNIQFFGKAISTENLSTKALESNIALKGNNLLGLHSLKVNYGGKVDIIYIDPPYYFKTLKASDTFAYNSNFKLSTWLTFMQNRLEVAKDLLSSSGVIYISISEDGMNHLKLLCDEVFGADRFITTFIWKKRAGGGNDSEGIAVDHEYILCYGNVSGFKKLPFTEEQLKSYKHVDSKVETHGPYSLKNLHDSSLQDSKGLHFDIECPDGSILLGKNHQWKCNKETFDERLDDDRIVFSQANGKWRVEYKIYLYENKGKLLYDDEGNLVHKGIIPNALLENVGLNSQGTRDLKKLFPESKNLFRNPKPVSLVAHLIKIVDNKNATVLDFFAGSGTTAHATMEVNKHDGGKRKFILLEQMDYFDDLTCERIRRASEKFEYHVEFIRAELVPVNQVYINKILKAAETSELLDIWQEIQTKGFISYRVSELGELNKQKLPSLDTTVLKQFLVDALDQNMLYLAATEVEDVDFSLSPGVIDFNKSFYEGYLNA